MSCLIESEPSVNVCVRVDKETFCLEELRASLSLCEHVDTPDKVIPYTIATKWHAYVCV